MPIDFQPLDFQPETKIDFVPESPTQAPPTDKTLLSQLAVKVPEVIKEMGVEFPTEIPGLHPDDVSAINDIKKKMVLREATKRANESPVMPIVRGAEQTAVEFAEAMRQPENIALAGAAAIAPESLLVRAGLTGLMGGLAAKTVGSGAGELSVPQTSLEQATKDILGMAAMTIGAKGAAEIKPSPELPKLISEKVKPVAPLTAEALSKEPSIEKGPTDAIHTEAAQPVRNVREQPIEGVREMPVEKAVAQDDEGGRQGASPGSGEGLSSNPALRGLQTAWEGLTTAVKTSANKEDMAAHMDAAENMARLSGNQMENRVKLWAPDEADREALTFIIEANGDPAKLADMSPKVGEKYQPIVNHALENWNRLKPIADQISELQESQRQFEINAGVDTDYVEGYVKHAYDRDLMMGVNRPVVFGSRSGSGVGTAFKKQRVFPTYADAIEAGYTPQTLDVAKLMNSRTAAGTKLVNRIQWGNALRDVEDPTSGKPVVTSLTKQPKGTEVPPTGYTANEIIPGMRVAVHEGYESMFDALTGGSKIAEFEVKGIPVGELALKIEGAIKHGLLAFDTFHASRIMQKQLFLTGRLGWANGKTLLDYSDKDLSMAVDQDLITKEMADYAKANRPTAHLLIQEGLNVGRVQEALYNSTVQNLPVIGPFNRWVFDKVTRGAMMESGIIEFDRVKKQNPDMANVDVARKVSGDLNTYFGNLGRQGIFKSKTYQDLARLAFLAPQWVESMVRTEAKGYGQLAKAPYDSVRARQLQVGTLAKGVGQGLIAYFVGTQLLNLATRRQFTWDNPEKDHKLDAWIPDLVEGGPGFFMSPFSVVAELTHDFIRYSSTKDTPLDAAAQIAKNKLSPLSRSAEVLFSGKDYRGKQLDGTWERVKEAGWSLAPTPIPLSAPIRGSQYPGQVERQIISSAGFKVEPKPTEQQEAGRAKFRAMEEKKAARKKAREAGK